MSLLHFFSKPSINSRMVSDPPPSHPRSLSVLGSRKVPRGTNPGTAFPRPRMAGKGFPLCTAIIVNLQLLHLADPRLISYARPLSWNLQLLHLRDPRVVKRALGRVLFTICGFRYSARPCWPCVCRLLHVRTQALSGARITKHCVQSWPHGLPSAKLGKFRRRRLRR